MVHRQNVQKPVVRVLVLTQGLKGMSAEAVRVQPTRPPTPTFPCLSRLKFQKPAAQLQVAHYCSREGFADGMFLSLSRRRRPPHIETTGCRCNSNLSPTTNGSERESGRRQARQWEKVTPPHAVAPAANTITTPIAAAATPVLTFRQYMVRLRLRDARSKRNACWFSWSVLSTNSWGEEGAREPGMQAGRGGAGRGAGRRVKNRIKREQHNNRIMRPHR